MEYAALHNASQIDNRSPVQWLAGKWEEFEMVDEQMELATLNRYIGDTLPLEYKLENWNARREADVLDVVNNASLFRPISVLSTAKPE
jgi:hypothetical protein